MEDTALGSERDVEVAPALISVHPSQHSVAVAVGRDLRVFDLRKGCGVSLCDESGGSHHKDSIRAIRFGVRGKLFVSAGDDKLVKIWSAETWRCISSLCSEKRVSAVAVSHDERYVCFADKFGVVWVVDLEGLDFNGGSADKMAAPLLAHYCSIITSLEFSPDGKFIVSADRDFKIRVTIFPKKPLDGAHEIQSFCLGHTEFVSCIAFISSTDNPQGFLVSGSGDSSVRLWDISSGSLLDTCDVRSKLTSATGCLLKAEHLGRSDCDDSFTAVTDICTVPGVDLVAVAVQSLQGIMLLSCNHTVHVLHVAKVVAIPGESFIPTSLSSSSSGDLLWMVTGVSKLNGSDQSPMVRLRLLSGLRKNTSGQAGSDIAVLKDDEVPGAKELLEALQGSIFIEEKVLSEAAKAVKAAMSNLLIKKQYPADTREFRKRTRNDKKMKQ